MVRHPIQITLDGQGNGYNDVAVPFTHVVALFQNGADPATGHAYTSISRLSASEEGQGTRIEAEGGPPGGQILVFVTEAV